VGCFGVVSESGGSAVGRVAALANTYWMVNVGAQAFT